MPTSELLATIGRTVLTALKIGWPMLVFVLFAEWSRRFRRGNREDKP